MVSVWSALTWNKARCRGARACRFQVPLWSSSASSASVWNSARGSNSAEMPQPWRYPNESKGMKLSRKNEKIEWFYIKSFYTSDVINSLCRFHSAVPVTMDKCLPENDAEPPAATCQGLRNALHRGKRLSDSHQRHWPSMGKPSVINLPFRDGWYHLLKWWSI